MISKETFVNTMNKLQNLDKKMDAVDKALKALDSDFCSFYVTGIFDTTFDLLKEAMNDKDDWIKYFVYERDWLRDFQLGDVEVDGEPVKIYTWGDVYDFMTSTGEQA